MHDRRQVDAVQWARSDDEARTIIAVSFPQRLVGADEILSVLGRMRVVKRQALVLATTLDARAGSETITELDLVTLCRRGGLPVPTRQVFRKDGSGRTRCLDALFDEWGVRVEIDGAHHMFVDEWWRDMERHNDLAARDEVLLLFPAWKVRYRPEEVIARMRKALLEAGWRPGT